MTSRRSFLKKTAAATALAASGCGSDALKAFMRDRLREMSQPELREFLADLEARYKKQFGREVEVHSTPAREGVVFGYGLDLSRCNGNRRCVHACVKENNQSRNPEMQYIRVIEMPQGTFNLEQGDHHFDGDVPRDGHYYLPVQCHQCANPPCVKVCPIEATWQEPDGITVIDYDWCIGCRCCMSACPYGARHFNWAEPRISADEVNPDMHVLGNRPRPKGVVEKCTFCIHRVRKGRYPACVEICPVGARKFGNLLDENSEIRYLMREKRVFVLKEDLNTQPKFYYFYAT